MNTSQDKSTKKDGKGDEKTARRRMKKLCKSIRSQIEFYFGDANLSKDRFMKQEIDKNKGGWVPIAVFRNFNRMRKLSTDEGVIAKALSSSELIEVSEDKQSVRRKTTFVNTVRPNLDDRTIYVECLPHEADHEWVKKVFAPYGQVLYVSMPKFQTTGDFKGFAFVEFDSIEAAEKAKKEMNNPPASAADKFAFFPRAGNSDMQRLRRTVQFYEGELNKHKRKRTISDPSEATDVQDLNTKKRSRTVSEGNESETTQLTAKELKPDKSVQISSETVQTQNKTYGTIEGEAQNRKRRFDDSDEESSKEGNAKQAKYCEEEKDAKKKKTRSKKNKDKKDKEDSVVPELRILSKKEWLKLRVEYKSMQKENMKKLKQSLQEYRKSEREEGVEEPLQENNDTNESSEKTGESGDTAQEAKKRRMPQFLPNVIVRVQSHVPMKRLELTDKVRKHGNIAYVDVCEESMEGYIRCKDEATAAKLADVHVANHAFSLVTGEDEKKYWDKLNADREKKWNSKSKKKDKGKVKLEKKAEKVSHAIIQQSHVVFDED